MSLDLKDFRLGITAEIDAALTAVSRAFGRDKQEVAREILGEWAVRLWDYAVAPKSPDVPVPERLRGAASSEAAKRDMFSGR